MYSGQTPDEQIPKINKPQNSDKIELNETEIMNVVQKTLFGKAAQALKGEYWKRGKDRGGRFLLFSYLQKGIINAKVDIREILGGDIIINSEYWHKLTPVKFSKLFQKNQSNDNTSYFINGKDLVLELIRKNFNESEHSIQGDSHLINLASRISNNDHGFLDANFEMFIDNDELNEAIANIEGDVIRQKTEPSDLEERTSRGRPASDRRYIYAICAVFQMLDRYDPVYINKIGKKQLAKAEFFVEMAERLFDAHDRISAKTIERDITEMTSEIESIIEELISSEN